jgi:hypothetical protein
MAIRKAPAHSNQSYPMRSTAVDMMDNASAGESAVGIAPSAARRTERETLASLSSHQVNTPVIPSRQCTNMSACSRAIRSRKRPARTFFAAKRLNFRII